MIFGKITVYYALILSCLFSLYYTSEAQSKNLLKNSVSILQDGHEIRPMMQSNFGLILLPSKKPFQLLIKSSLSPWRVYLALADKAELIALAKKPRPIDFARYFRPGYALPANGPYPLLHLMDDAGFHLILPDRCHSFESLPLNIGECAWRIHSLYNHKMQAHGSIEDYPWRNLSLLFWFDVNNNRLVEMGELQFYQIILPSLSPALKD